MEIEEIIISQIKSYNETADRVVDLSAGTNTILFGAGSTIDSIDFVSLIIDIEQAIEDQFGKKISLSNEKAFSLKNSPFRTIGTLAEYIKGELNG